jgi:hypothetical protein
MNHRRLLSLREGEYNRGTGCYKTARPGLYGGRQIIGIPTARERKIIKMEALHDFR